MNPNRLIEMKINELMYNKVTKYNSSMNTLLESEELKRKLSLTSILVLDLYQDVAIVSPQYIVINPKSVEKFMKPQNIEIHEEVKIISQLNVGLTNFISDLLKQSMGKNPNDLQNTAKVMSHEELIKFIDKIDPKMSKQMSEQSLNSQEFILAQQYFETGNNLEKINSNLINYNLTNQPLYPRKLLKDEIYLKTMAKDIKTFYKLYEENKDEEIRDYLVAGITAKIVGNVMTSRKYISLKAWENLTDMMGLNSSDYPSVTSPNYKVLNGRELKEQLKIRIGHAANSIINNPEQRDLLIHGISGFAKIEYMFDVVKVEKNQYPRVKYVNNTNKNKL